MLQSFPGLFGGRGFPDYYFFFLLLSPVKFTVNFVKVYLNVLLLGYLIISYSYIKLISDHFVSNSSVT